MARRSKKNDIRDRVKAYTKQAIVEADTFRQEVLFPAVMKANAQYRGDLPTRLTPKKRRRIYYQKTRQRVQALQGEIINAAFSAGRNLLNLRRQGLEDNAEVRVLHEVVNWISGTRSTPLGCSWTRGKTRNYATRRPSR